MLNKWQHRLTALRDPNTWRVTRGDHPSGREYLLRNEITGNEMRVIVFALSSVVHSGETATTVHWGSWIESGPCTCSQWERAKAEHGYCEHTACVEAIRRYCAREKEKASVPDAERRARVAEEIRSAFGG